jgi:hypothetical protein
MAGPTEIKSERVRGSEAIKNLLDRDTLRNYIGLV